MWALCCDTKGYRGALETVDLQHIDSKSFPSQQHGTLTKCWFIVGRRRRRWSNIKSIGPISRWSSIL